MLFCFHQIVNADSSSSRGLAISQLWLKPLRLSMAVQQCKDVQKQRLALPSPFSHYWVVSAASPRVY